MTAHAHGYKCECGKINYVPFPGTEKCPKCDRRFLKTFEDFVNDTSSAAWYHLTSYGSFVPPAYAILSPADHYYYLAFKFLIFASSFFGVPQKDLATQKVSKAAAKNLVSIFLERFKFGNEQQSKNLQIYFIRLICSLKTSQVRKEWSKNKIVKRFKELNQLSERVAKEEGKNYENLPKEEKLRFLAAVLRQDWEKRRNLNSWGTKTILKTDDIKAIVTRLKKEEEQLKEKEIHNKRWYIRLYTFLKRILWIR